MQEFASEVVGNQPEDLTIITEIELRVDTPLTSAETLTPIEQKIEDIKAIIEENILDEYANDPTGLTESDLFAESGHENQVSVIDVIVADELEEVIARSPEVSPEVIETVQELEEEIINEFIETVSVEAATDTLHVLEPIPQIIETLAGLKEEASVSADAKIDAAIEVQVGIIEEYIQTIDDPQTLETYITQIEESPIVSEVIEEVGGEEFNKVIKQVTQEVTQVAVEEQTVLETTIAQIQEEIFSASSSDPSSIEETLAASVQEQIQEIKQEIPTEQILEVTISTETTVTTEPAQVSESVQVEQQAPAVVQEAAPPPQESAPAPVESAPAPQTESAPPPAEAPVEPAVEAPAL